MVLVDTSVWVDVFRDSKGKRAQTLKRAVGDEDIVLAHFIELELLQGARDESEWTLLASYLETQEYLEATSSTWLAAARIYFDLRRLGRTVRSPIDCCIAQIAIDGGATLIHRDRDFEAIGEIADLQQAWIDW